MSGAETSEGRSHSKGQHGSDTQLHDCVETILCSERSNGTNGLSDLHSSAQLSFGDPDQHGYPNIADWHGAFSSPPSRAPAWLQELSTTNETSWLDLAWIESEVGGYVCPDNIEFPSPDLEPSSQHANCAGNIASLSDWSSSPSVQIVKPSVGPTRAHHTARGCTQLLKDWLLDHVANPYPDETQLLELAVATRRTTHQARISLNNLRARMKAEDTTSSRRPLHMLSSSGDGSILPEATSALLSIGQIDMEVMHTLNLGRREHGLSNLQAVPSHAAHISDVDVQSNDFDYMQIIDDSHGASSQRDDLNPCRITNKSIQKRKGKKLYTSRYLPGATAPIASGNAKETLLKTSPVYYCTVCPKAFSNMYGWRRHEASVHEFHITEWVCMLDGSIIDGINCAFCFEIFPEFEHNEQHDILKCLLKPDDQRTFVRKDGLKQHIQLVHLADMEAPEKKAFKIPDAWSRNVEAHRSDPRSLWCGICTKVFESTAVRMDHVADHFRKGVDMSTWVPRPGC